MADDSRGCYCGLWDTDPKVLQNQGLPEGFCGFCAVCGKPGHTRHFPGPSPVTGAWCDRHYRLVALFHPLGFLGRYLWPALMVLLVVLWSLFR